MSSTIDADVTAGTMTSDQAAALKKELADVTSLLSQSAQTSSTAATSTTPSTSTSNQTNPLSQLSDADHKKVFSELQDVRKQLFAVSDAQGTDATSASAASGNNDAISNLFAQIDTDGNGTIDQSEFTQFLAQIGANALGYNMQGTANTASGSWLSSFQAMA